MELRSKSVNMKEPHLFNVKRNTQLDLEKIYVEDKLLQLDKLNEFYLEKNKQIEKIQESLRVKGK